MKGRCVICGEIGKLTDDHVPPRSVSPATPLELRRLGATIKSEPSTDVRGGFQAAKFPSLCRRCNSDRLGTRYDPVLSKFASDIRRWIGAATSLKLWIGRSIDVETETLSWARSVVGHLLAAEERRDPWTIPPEGTSTRALKTFFLDDESQWPPDMHLSAWLYPARAQVIVKGFAVSGILGPNRYGPIIGDVLKFFPVAFWVTVGSAAGCRQNLTEVPLAGARCRRDVDASCWRGRRRPETVYACRNVRMGSTFAARAAGIHAASRHTATIRPRLAR
jgi:hypothetical protein